MLSSTSCTMTCSVQQRQCREDPLDPHPSGGNRLHPGQPTSACGAMRRRVSSPWAAVRTCEASFAGSRNVAGADAGLVGWGELGRLDTSSAELMRSRWRIWPSTRHSYSASGLVRSSVVSPSTSRLKRADSLPRP